MTKYIAIDGNGGSGKTYLSNILAKRLGAPVYHLDDYGNDYQPFIGIPAMIKEVAGKTDELVIVEGIGVFDTRFDFLNPYRVYVNTPEKIREKRSMARDRPTAERSVEEWEKIYKIWEVETSEYIKNASKRADLIVNDSNSIVADLIVTRTREFREDTRSS